MCSEIVPKSKSYYEANKEKILAQKKEYHKANKEKIRAQRKEYLKANREKVLAQKKEYRKLNKEKVALQQKSWNDSNRDKKTALEAKRRAAKLSATPHWLTDSMLEEISSFYWLAKDLRLINGEPYHVDHIVPLLGGNVCGLHVPWNLQVLPADINISKSNKTELEEGS